MFSRTPLRLFLGPAALAGVLAACGGDETQPTEDHTPATYSILIDGQAASAPYTFTEGEVVRVQIKFFNQAAQDLDDVESSHFGGLTFNPTSLAASVDRVSGHNYQFDVTVGTPGTGTLQVSYGHEDPPDEHSFPAAAVTVNSTGGGGGPL